MEGRGSLMGNNLSNYAIIDVTPTLNTNEYVDGDALFNKVEIYIIEF